MRAWAVVGVWVALAWSASAHAQDWKAAVRAGVGYDTNPVFLETRAAALPGVTDPTAPSLYGGVGASAQLGSGDATRLTLGLDGSARAYFSGHVASFARLAAGASTRLAPAFALVMRVEGTRFDTSLSRDEATTGRLRVGAGWRASAGLTIGIDAMAGARAYDTGDQLDGLFGGGLDVRLDVGRKARLSGGLDVERRESDVLRATRWEIAPWLAMSLEPARTLRLTASYALYLRAFEIDRRSGVEHAALLEAAWMPWRAFGFFASVEGGLARGNAEALRYERLDVLLGVRAALDTTARPSRDGDARADVPPAPLTQDGPASPGSRPGTIHFRVEARGASRVAVVGTFDDWSEEAGALVERSLGVFEGDLAVPPGHHVYHLIVDGRPVRPANAQRYVDDGFGNEDAVLEVPAP